MKQLSRVFLAGVLGLGVAWASFAQEATTADTDYQAKLQQLEANIAELKSKLAGVRSERENLQEELEEKETEISELLKKIENIKTQLGREEARLDDLNQQRSLLVSRQLAQKKHIAQQVRAAYRLGGQSNIKLLLNQEDPARISRLLRYYDYFLAARNDKLGEYRRVVAELNTLEPQIVRNTQSLKANRESLQRRYAELEAKQAQRAHTLARLNATIENKDQELQKLAQDRDRIQQLLDKIATVVGTRPFSNDDNPFSQLQGKLRWPTPGRLAQRFGSDRVPGKMQWDGVLIAAAEGAPVKAIHHGRVVFADYLRGQGLLVIVDHGEGFMSLYAHNRTLTKTPGNWVEAGEVIATVGNSGGQSLVGLYFEIRQNGTPVNPDRWCG